MKKGKKKLAVLISMAVMAGICSFQVFAATKISTISLDVESELKVGDDYSTDDIEVSVKGTTNYSVGDIEILNEGDWWESDDTPRIKVFLNAADGYYFSVTKKDIKLKGATYVTSKREDSYTFTVTMDLPSMLETIGEVTAVRWDSNRGASWDQVENAGGYEVRLYRDNKSVGGTQKVTDTKIDFGSLMRKEGTYTFKVRAVNVKNENTKSEWLEVSSTSYIDEATAEQMRTLYGNEIPDWMTEPGQQQSQPLDQYGWIADGNGWWYRNADGSYPSNSWQQIEGKWYYFNSRGYMVTGWVDWNGKSYYCDPVDGYMWVDNIIPDGSGRRVDSTGAWIQ